MKIYAYKILATIAVIASFLLVVNFSYSIDLDKSIRTIANSEKLASGCTPENPETYYTTTSLNVRTGPGAGYTRVTTLTTCTEVKVYCTTGNWGRISNSSDKYASMTYLTKSSSGCSSITQTTTNEITYSLGNLNMSSLAKYTDKEGTITFDINNVTNLASGEEDRLTVEIIGPDGSDVTSNFSITKGKLNGSKISVTLTKKNSVTYADGTYTINLLGGRNTGSSLSFGFEGKYYNFELELEKITNYDNNATNKENKWEVQLIDVEPSNLNTSKLTVEILNSNGVNYTDKFNVSLNASTLTYTISNKPEKGFNRLFGTYAPEGNYTIKISFLDEDYSDVRGTISKEKYITLGRAVATFEEDTENRVSYRYVPSYKLEDYEIYIISVANNNGVNTYTFMENNEEQKMTEEKMKEVYGSLDLNNITFENGNVVVPYGNQLTITKNQLVTTDGVSEYHITFKDSTGLTQTLPASEFQLLYPSAYETLTSSGSYYSMEDGTIMYRNAGVGTKQTVTYQIMTDKIRTPLSNTGGEYIITVNYEELETYDFDNAHLSLRRDSGEVLIYDDDVRDDNFEIFWEYEPYEESKKAKIYIKYKGTDSEKYNDTYQIVADFGKYDKFTLEFTLTDGNTDYYLYSEYDAHLTSNDPLVDVKHPPSNKKYEYYVGFYMIKGAALLTEIEKSSINYRIFNRRADYDTSGYLYFYDQIDYEIRITNVLNNIVTFDISYDSGVTYTRNQKLSRTEFANKYQHASDLIPNYTFDSNGYITGDNFSIHVKRLYLEPGNTDMTVVYQVGTDTTNHTMMLSDFKLTYPEMYGYAVTRFVFDADGYIVPGGVLGNYRVTHDDNGVPLSGEEVTDQFDVVVNKENSDPSRTLTILPKTEVEHGDYYIYVSYGAAFPGVGYVNNSTDDPALSPELFPEMWNQNTHMTIISYSEPQYTISINNPKQSNGGNDKERVYSNIDGETAFDISLNYIYNLEGVSHSVQYYDGSNWIDATDHFTAITDYNTGDSKITLHNVVGKVKEGKYRLSMSYTNKGFSSPVATKEFEVLGNYYGLIIDKSKTVEFHYNFSGVQNVVADGYYINNPNNIQISISRYLADGYYEDYTWNKNTKEFYNDENKLQFSYDVEVENIDEITIKYILKLKNHAFVTPKGTYKLILAYQEANGDTVSSEYEFIIGDEMFIFELGEEIPVANSSEQYIKRDMAVHYFDYDFLDDIQYTVYYYYQGAYVPVSGSKAEFEMFEFRYRWDEPNSSGGEFDEPQTTYPGTLYIDINPENVDMDGMYYIEMRYDNQYEEFEMSNLRELFTWNIENVSITGTHEDEDGNITDVEGFYRNITDTTIDVTLKTMHEENAKYSINTECLEGECIPSSAINFNNRFDVITHTNDNIKLRLKENLDKDLMLTPGNYAFTVYYSDTDFKVYEFTVGVDFVDIEMEEYIIETVINNDTIIYGDLFSNKSSKISIPVSVRGVPYSDTIISITDVTGNQDMSEYFTINQTEYEENHNLIIDYNLNSQIPAGDYMVMISYVNTDGSIESDYIILTFNQVYFNYEVTNTTFNPNPPVPNAKDGGTITMTVNTQDMLNGDTIEQETTKSNFIRNITITNPIGEDVTDLFNISYANDASNVLNFNVILEYEEDVLTPGNYVVNMSYTKMTYQLDRSYEFEMGDYERRLDIGEIEISSDTNNNKVHNNVGGSFKVNFITNYDIYTSDYVVNIFDENQNNVTSSFTITKNNKYVRIGYTATEPYIEAGDYTVNIIYTDPQTGTVDTNSTTIHIYGEYKEIIINNMTTNSERIYADLDGQYYTFNLETGALTAEEISNIKARIYDKYGNIVYSNIESDNITNQFGFEKISDSQYRINILAYKARVDNYEVVLCIPSSDGTINESNRLTFAIHSTYYKVVLEDESTIVPIETFDSNNTIYDYIGVHANYLFTSNYDKGGAKYTIKVLKNGIMLKEIADIDVETTMGYLETEFDVDDVDNGDIEIAICLNGLPYDSRTVTMEEYIKVTNASIVMDNKNISGSIDLKTGDIKELEFTVEPSNATNKNLKFTSSNTNVATFNGNTLTIVGAGTSIIKLSNKEYSIEITVNASERLTSNVYVVDNNAKTIYVNSMRTTSLTKELFASNLSGLYSTYRILDASGTDVTASTLVVGTNYSIINGNDTYKVILIGDLNANGYLDIGDVAYLYQLYRGKVQTTDENVILASRVRKDTIVNIGDVTKLFQFVRGKINEV